MKRLFGSIRFKIVVLAILVGLTFQAGLTANETKACEDCVFPTGGICVGCLSGEGPWDTCRPVQAECACYVTGGGCID